MSHAASSGKRCAVHVGKENSPQGAQVSIESRLPMHWPGRYALSDALRMLNNASVLLSRSACSRCDMLRSLCRSLWRESRETAKQCQILPTNWELALFASCTELQRTSVTERVPNSSFGQQG